MHVSSFREWGTHFKHHNNGRKERMKYALEHVLGVYRNAIQLLIFHCIVQHKLLVNSEKEKRHIYPNKVQNTFPAPHPFMLHARSLISLASKLMTFI